MGLKTKLRRHNIQKALLKNIRIQMETSRVYRADMKNLREQQAMLEKELKELDEG